MVLRLDTVVSLGKTAAGIAADFSPVPGLSIAVDLVCFIIELCENVPHNRQAARQLRDRCHVLLMALRDHDQTKVNAKINDAINAVNDCLLDIKTRMHGWTLMGKTQSFLKQREVEADIEHCHREISDCVIKFQLVSHMEIHAWQNEFAANKQKDQDQLLEYLSEIQNSQAITNDALNTNTDMLRQMMGMMQGLMSEKLRNDDQRRHGISNNLFQLQMHSKELLPNFNLSSGEVKRVGNYPVSGTSGMDIYEGLYLENLKVAIKVLRSVSANEHSLRRFNREVKIWSELWRVDRGQHILPFYGFCQTDGPYPYMVSPWQPNGSALDYVKANRDELVDHKRLIKNIAHGIEILHNMKPPVVHGDIKASNIFIDTLGNPLIADFGLSQFIEDINGVPFTQSRGVSESYRWFAPEVYDGVLSVGSDIYAYGMTVLELMTHKYPYEEIRQSTKVVILTTKGERPQRPTRPQVVKRGLDDHLWSLLNECWAQNDYERPTIQHVLSALS